MTDLSSLDPADGLSDRTLVTVLLLAFNQEKFVRDAIMAIFRQTYGPLEILLSDDCSTDRTFEIMQEIVAAYDGPHRIRLYRNTHNLGLLPHVLLRGREASGEIIVMAAGDDVSAPDRVARSVEAFGPNVGAVYSLISLIDENGDTVVPCAERPLLSVKPTFPFFQREITPIQGCSAAYRRWVFDVPVDPAGKSYPEDLLFSFYLALRGSKTILLESPLVGYRSHAGSISNYHDSDPPENEKRYRRAADEALQVLDDAQKIAAVLGQADAFEATELAKRRAFYQDMVDWPGLSFPKKLKRALFPGDGARSGEGGTSRRQYVWRFVRLWGHYPHYQPKMYLARFQKSYRHTPDGDGS